MAPRVKLGKFAKRTIAAKKRTQTLPNMINSKSVQKAVGEAITGMSEAQWKRSQTNKVPTKKEALDMAEKIAKGAAVRPRVKPLMIALMPHVTVKQPVPYKPSTVKK